MFESKKRLRETVTDLITARDDLQRTLDAERKRANEAKDEAALSRKRIVELEADLKRARDENAKYKLQTHDAGDGWIMIREDRYKELTDKIDQLKKARAHDKRAVGAMAQRQRYTPPNPYGYNYGYGPIGPGGIFG